MNGTSLSWVWPGAGQRDGQSQREEAGGGRQDPPSEILRGLSLLQRRNHPSQLESHLNRFALALYISAAAPCVDLDRDRPVTAKIQREIKAAGAGGRDAPNSSGNSQNTPNQLGGRKPGLKQAFPRGLAF